LKFTADSRMITL